MRYNQIDMIKSGNIKIGLVLMASGQSRRFGRDKLVEMLCAKPVIKWIIDAAEALFDKRVVVTRSEAVKRLCEELGIDCIYHDLPGRNDAVRLGLEALMDDIDYCMFAQCDQPLVTRESICGILDKAQKREGLIIRLAFGDTAAAPVCFHKKYFADLLALPEGKGGGQVIRQNPQAVCLVRAQQEYELWDIDTVGDLEKINELIVTEGIK